MTFPTLAVQIAFDNGPLEASPTWETVTGVMAVRINRGRSGSLEKTDTGHCTITLNNSTRLYDPTNTSSSAYGNSFRLEPGKRVRVRATIGGNTYSLFTGNIESWAWRYSQEDSAPALGPRGAVTIECLDAFGYFNTRTLNLVRGVENDGPRMTAILDYLGWPSGASWRAITSASYTMSARTYTNANALESMLEVASIGDSYLFMDRNSKIIMNPKSTRATTDIAVTFGSTFPYEAADIAYDRRDLVNEARLTDNTSTTYTSLGVTAGSYFQRSYAATLDTNNDLQARVDSLVQRRQYPVRDARRLLVRGRTLATTLFWVHLFSTIDLDERIAVTTTPATGASVTYSGFVEGEQWTITTNPGEWVVEYTLSPARFSISWILGFTDLSELGTTTILG